MTKITFSFTNLHRPTRSSMLEQTESDQLADMVCLYPRPHSECASESLYRAEYLSQLLILLSIVDIFKKISEI